MTIHDNKMAITSNSVKDCLTFYFIGVLLIHALLLARLCEKGLIMKTFTAYSLKLILQANIKGFNICGLTTNRFNGLHQTSMYKGL